jgi:hypothetical protein
MSTIVVVELKRYGWRQKIVKKRFIIVGRAPYVETLKLHQVWRKALPSRKGRSKRYAENIWLFPTAPDAVPFSDE